jgi:arginase family enzyme
VLETHDRVTVALEAIHGLGLVPICLGGGHDLTRASVRGLARSAGGALGGINMDAHLDVREAVGSGMPFRRLIEDGELDGRRFVELGIGRHACDAEHLAYLAERGARVIGVERALSDPDGAVDEAFGVALAGGGPAFVSIDLDGIDGSRAPGVSSPSPMGLETPTAAAIALRAGREPGVGHFDVMELNPTYDLDGRTARVAALLVLQFVSGFAERAS